MPPCAATLCISIQLEDANYDASAALAMASGSSAAAHAEAEWVFLRFRDARGLSRAVKRACAALQREAAPRRPTLLLFHTHVVADKRSKNQGDFMPCFLNR